MSAQITVHRMTTTTTTTAVLLNIGYLKTLPGILKICQIVLGVVAIAIIGMYQDWCSYQGVPELFFLLVGTTCLITTTLLLLSCLCSIGTASIIPKTLFESMYHVVAFLLYFAAGVCLIVYLNEQDSYGRRVNRSNYGPKTAAASIGLVNTVLYFLSSFYSVRTYRRG